MLPKIKGRAAWVFKETNYDIDNIVGVANITLTDIEQMKKVCMTDYDPDFAAAVQDGDVLVGGENFGYGHPHYVAFKALRALVFVPYLRRASIPASTKARFPMAWHSSRSPVF